MAVLNVVCGSFVASLVHQWWKFFPSTLRLFTYSLFTLAQEKASAKHTVMGVGFASKVSKKNRGAVDILGKEWTY